MGTREIKIVIVTGLVDCGEKIRRMFKKVPRCRFNQSNLIPIGPAYSSPRILGDIT